MAPSSCLQGFSMAADGYSLLGRVAFACGVLNRTRKAGP